MKEKVKVFLCVCLLMVALPYIITMMFQGKTSEDSVITFSTDNITPENNTSKDLSGSVASGMDMEVYLAGIVAKEIPHTYETEALKAQAVAARTNLMDAVEKGEELPQSLGQEEMLAMWGQEGYNRNYQRIVEAVEETKGKVLTYEGNYIYAAYHAVSAGNTRNAKESFGYEKMPWLEGSDSSWDISAGDFLKVIFFKPQEIQEKLAEAFPEAEIPETNLLEYIQITKRDTHEYVTEIKLGEETMTGEDFRELFALNSACFYLTEVEGDVRVVSKGLGHGLGLSQYGANEMAKDGKDFQEILQYYFKNIEISD